MARRWLVKTFGHWPIVGYVDLSVGLVIAVARLDFESNQSVPLRYFLLHVIACIGMTVTVEHNSRWRPAGTLRLMRNG